jgi:hypothetical protein
MSDKKRYQVKVTETHLFWGLIEVEACNQEEAQEIAEEEFQVNWDDSDLLERDTQIVTENGAARRPHVITLRSSIDIGDVKEVRPDLTDAQASEVLEEVERFCEGSVTWDELEWIADGLFPDTPQSHEE